MSQTSFQIEPFTAVGLSRLSDADRRAKLTAMGAKHLRRRKLFQWDGGDLDRSLHLAMSAYLRVMGTLAKAGAA